MSSRIPAAVFASAFVGLLFSVSMIAVGVSADPVVIGLYKPAGVIGQGVDIAAPLREALLEGLRAANAQVVMLDANDPSQAMAEAAQKNCAFVLWTRASQGRGGPMGLGKKMSMIMPRKQNAADNPAPVPGADDLKSLPSAEKTVLKAGDQVNLEYRLMARGTEVSNGKLDGKAQSDGEDVLGPLVAQLSTIVVKVATGGAAGARATSAATPPPTSSSNVDGNTRSGRGRTNASANQGMPANMNCEQMAAASHGSITVDACKQMMGAQQAREAALADPRASRPGDDKMTCDQIVAEIKQQQITKPDAAKAAEAQAAVTDAQKTAAKQQAEVQAVVAKESAEELAQAPKRMFEPNAAGAADAKRREAEHKEMNERLAAEMQPKAERQMTASADLMSDFTKQFQDNPRLAKLFDMADRKRCQVK